MEAFTGFGNKTQKGMIGFLTFFLRVVPFGSPFLRTEYRPHSGIKFESDFAEIFFGPYLSANYVLNLGQFFTVLEGEEFENTAEGGSIWKLFPLEQLPERFVRSEKGKMTDVLGSSEHTENQHQNRIRNLIGSVFTSFDTDVLVKELMQVEFFGESAEEGQPGIAGEIFLIECSMKYSHHMSASLLSPVPLPGVAFLVGLLQIIDGEPGIMSEGVQGLVAEQLLDVVHVGPAPDQLRGAASAEGVRRDAIISRAFCVGVHALKNARYLRRSPDNPGMYSIFFHM